MVTHTSHVINLDGLDAYAALDGNFAGGTLEPIEHVREVQLASRCLLGYEVDFQDELVVGVRGGNDLDVVDAVQLLVAADQSAPRLVVANQALVTFRGHLL